MNRTQYLANSVVKQFVQWLAANLNTNTFSHSYIDRRSRTPWSCTGLADAFIKYRWTHGPYGSTSKGDTADSNNKVLLALKRDLELALIPPMNDQSACDAAKAVMTWGGVRNGNVSWLEANKRSLTDHLTWVRDLLDEGDLKRLSNHTKAIRFNAGMTKIYSLIAQDFIIYDSRVAAALGWAVTKFCADRLHTTPEELAFPWAPAKEAPNARAPKRRNPSVGTLIFPRLRQGKHHAEWNLKASWVLQAVHDLRSPLSNGSHLSPLRQMEAALFMIGYDLPPLPTGAVLSANVTTPTRRPSKDVSWNDGYTPTKRNHFRYRLTDYGIKVENGQSFSLADIALTLDWLWRHFEKKAFPLENSRSKWQSQNLSPGLGLAYANETNRCPVHTSRLAAVLLDIGVIQAVAGTKKWRLDSQLFSTNGIDMSALWETQMDREDAA